MIPRYLFQEAQIGFEPVIRELQSHALPLGYCALSMSTWRPSFGRLRAIHIAAVSKVSPDLQGDTMTPTGIEPVLPP